MESCISLIPNGTIYVEYRCILYTEWYSLSTSKEDRAINNVIMLSYWQPTWFIFSNTIEVK